jgi:hypothetical protein
MAAYVDDYMAAYVDDDVATDVKWITLWAKSSAHLISIETILAHQKYPSQFNTLQPNSHLSRKENQIQNSKIKLAKKPIITIANPTDHFKLFI